MHALVKLFEKVQAVPYQVSLFNEKDINENLRAGDCRHKSTLLFKLLQEAKFEVEKIKVLFDWKDLPIPSNTLALLKKSGTVWTHDALQVKINGKWIKIDCTWNPELEKIGFPITKNWSGLVDTTQVTKGKLQFLTPSEYLAHKKTSKINKEEAYEFAEQINELFASAR